MTIRYKGIFKMIEIRLMNKDDQLANLLQISREFFKEYEAYHPYFFKIDHLSDEDVQKYFLSFCEHETRKAFIAIENGKIIGYLTAYIKDQADYWQLKAVGEISGLMVQQAHRHKGVATSLLHEAEAFFTSRGVYCYTTYTSINNHGTLDFYNQMGMKPLYITLVCEI
jgi:GNAT superfamily N-acetyltransferase